MGECMYKVKCVPKKSNTWVQEVAKEIIGAKSISISVESFFFYQKMGHYPFRQTCISDKWDLRERYSGSNLSEKEF